MNANEISSDVGLAPCDCTKPIKDDIPHNLSSTGCHTSSICIRPSTTSKLSLIRVSKFPLGRCNRAAHIPCWGASVTPSSCGSNIPSQFFIAQCWCQYPSARFNATFFGGQQGDNGYCWVLKSMTFWTTATTISWVTASIARISDFVFFFCSPPRKRERIPLSSVPFFERQEA